VIAEAGAPYATHSVSRPDGEVVPTIRALIALAGQSAGVEKLGKFDPSRTTFLFLHGDADDCLPYRCTDMLMRAAPADAHKQKVILPGDHHGVQSALPILQSYIPKLLIK
jgi:hypothetical protein